MRGAREPLLDSWPSGPDLGGGRHGGAVCPIGRESGSTAARWLHRTYS